MRVCVVSNKRKKKNKISNDPIDLGAQELIRSEKDSTLVRKVDGSSFRLAFYGKDRHLEKTIKSLLENYYLRNLLDPKNRDINSRRFWAGERFEKIAHRSGMNQRVTTWLAEVSIGSNEDFLNDTIDSQSELHEALKSMKNVWSVVWNVILLNKSAGKQIDKLREGLDYLIEHFDM